MTDQMYYDISPDEWQRIVPLLTAPAPQLTPDERARADAVFDSVMGHYTPVALPVTPEWNKGVNTLAFSKLMVAWYEARANRDIHASITHIQAEKDAYFAVVDYIAKTQPPTIAAQTIPDDVNKAHADLAEVLADTWSMEELYDASYALSKALNKYVSKQEPSS